MFGIGGAELLIILVVALLVLGPEKLPGLARTLGRAMGEFRRMSTDFQRTLNVEAALDEDRHRNKPATTPVKPDAAKTDAVEPGAAEANMAETGVDTNSGQQCGKLDQHDESQPG